MSTYEKLMTEFRALTKEQQCEFLEELKKCSAQSANRTEHPTVGEVLHSHYTTENSKYKENTKNDSQNA